MATIVLGIVGAVVGSAVGGPAGAAWGWNIGTTLGALVDQPKLPTQDVGRLSDLRVGGSSYGSTIPQVWGQMRVAGNLIWATDLVEHETDQNSGGGKKGGGTTIRNFSYSCSFAVAICKGGRNPVVQRVWANDKIIYDVSQTSNAFTPTFYSGSETQAVDGFIAAQVTANPTPYNGAGGSGASPAYRGLCYAVFENMPLADYGNAIPNLSFEVQTDPVNVSDMLSDLAGQCGLTSADLDLTGAAEALTGAILANRDTAMNLLAPVLTAHLIDLVEVDGLLRAVKRGGEIVAALTLDDLGAQGVAAGQEPDPAGRLTETRTQEAELPARIDVSYYATLKHYEQATQGSVRQSLPLYNMITLSLPLSLADDEARQIGERQLYVAWREREGYQFALSWRWLRLTAADVVTIPVGQSTAPANVRVRITEMEIGLPGEMKVTAVRDDAQTYTQSVIGGVPNSPPPQNLTVIPTEFYAWSGQEIRDEDGLEAGFYVAATGALTGNESLYPTGSGNNGWTGGTIYYSPDGGTTWVVGGAAPSRAVFGTATSALADGVASDTFDTSHSVGVSIQSPGTLGSSTEALVRLGGNNALLGNEMLGFATATLTGSQAYTLSDLRRGFRGSPATGHVSGERFVLLTNAVQRVTVAPDLVGQTVLVKVLSDYQGLSDVTAQSVVIAAPNAPYQVTGQRAATVTLLTAFTPSATGPDAAQIPVPRDPNNPTSSITWYVKDIQVRAGTPATSGTTDIVVESSPPGAFTATQVNTTPVALSAGAYEPGTRPAAIAHPVVHSDDLLRVNLTALGAGLGGLTVSVLLSEQA